VVWAKAGPSEKARLETKAAAISETAKRCEGIMTCLARIPQKQTPVLRSELAPLLEANPNPMVRDRTAAPYTAVRAGIRHEGERSA
jgi:hypothetical protein